MDKPKNRHDTGGETPREGVEAVEAVVAGDFAPSGRRGFLRGAGLAAMSAAVGMTIPFHRNMPQGLIPAAFAQGDPLAGKLGLTLLNDRPVNAETPAELLDDRDHARRTGTSSATTATRPKASTRRPGR